MMVCIMVCNHCIPEFSLLNASVCGRLFVRTTVTGLDRKGKFRRLIIQRNQRASHLFYMAMTVAILQTGGLFGSCFGKIRHV